MKAVVKTLLVALTALLATAQRGGQFSYAGLIIDVTTHYIQEAGEENAFKPFLGALQVETDSTPKSVDKPVLRKLTFPLYETICERTADQTGKSCPLKRNGKSFLCSLVISQPVFDSSVPQSTDITCEPMNMSDQLQQKVRMRRSKAGKSSGGKKGSRGSKGSRPGGGSSIAGRDKGGSTRTA
ncbi:hypothetical protein GJAV_G00095800 [Gymnothorax javanicus]|nr:hypothetical protein GJAV_G00095800 [Gymnothorax javanicus]